MGLFAINVGDFLILLLSNTKFLILKLGFTVFSFFHYVIPVLSYWYSISTMAENGKMWCTIVLVPPPVPCSSSGSCEPVQWFLHWLWAHGVTYKRSEFCYCSKGRKMFTGILWQGRKGNILGVLTGAVQCGLSVPPPVPTLFFLAAALPASVSTSVPVFLVSPFLCTSLIHLSFIFPSPSAPQPVHPSAPLSGCSHSSLPEH